MRISSFSPFSSSLNKSQKAYSSVLEKLSSGKSINSAKDNPASYALAQALKSSSNALEVANRNISSASGALRIASGGVNQSIEQLQSLRDLAVQSANGTLNSSDRANLQETFSQGVENLDSISSNTQFNGQNLLDGSFDTSVQVGGESGQTQSVAVGSVSSSALGVSGLDISTQEGAQDAIEAIDDAIAQATSEASNIGASESALEYRESANAVAQENLEAARSQAEDLDYAEASSELSKQSVIQQAQLAVLKEQIKQKTAIADQLFGGKK